MNVLGLIPARGGSKGIKNKNLRDLGGKPLLAWTIEAALGSSKLTRTILSSDSPEIIETGKKLGVEVPFVRPPEFALDDTPAIEVVNHAIACLEEIENYRPDYIVWLQPTSPLRSSKHIDAALSSLLESDADSVISVTTTPHSSNPYSVMRMENEMLEHFLPFNERDNRRQLKPTFYSRNAAIYAFTYDCLINKKSFYGEKILPYIMTREDSFDIDEPLDLELCELMISRNRNNL